jgi:hypothetical protein
MLGKKKTPLSPSSHPDPMIALKLRHIQTLLATQDDARAQISLYLDEIASAHYGMSEAADNHGKNYSSSWHIDSSQFDTINRACAARISAAEHSISECRAIMATAQQGHRRLHRRSEPERLRSGLPEPGRKMTELSADEKARRIARSCHAAQVSDVDHWPIVIREGQYGNSGYIACGALTGRNFGSGELFTVECGSELDGSTLAELKESVIRHLCYVEHRSDWLSPPEKKFFAVSLENAPQVPPPPDCEAE